jgi:putative tricarboxylic transport membrane protein
MQRSLFPILFWILLSLFILFFSHDIGLGEFRSPGPGLMPFLVGAMLLLISIYALIRSAAKERQVTAASRGEGEHFRFPKIGLVLLFLLAYALLLEIIGYLVATFLMLVLLFRNAGVRGWISALVISLVTALATYAFFTYLGLRFPAGIFGIGGFLR